MFLLFAHEKYFADPAGKFIQGLLHQQADLGGIQKVIRQFWFCGINC
jgi:hypothetical protein